MALAAVTSLLQAQPAALDQYRQHLQHGVEAGVYGEIAVGWLDAGERQTWFFGRDAKPDLGSTFEIGAATEIFTGLLLAQAAYEGKLRLQNSVRELLPREFALADAGLGSITLRELATHRSGLPAMPPNLLPENAEDAYADYSRQDLDAFLANYRRGDAATVSGYSVLDAGLLGELLGRCYGQPYAELLGEKVLKPLGLEHTGFDDTLDLLAGHGRRGPAPHWHFGALAGAAGLRSNTGDLLAFLQQNLQPATSKLRAALLLARQPQSGAKQDVGLGWNIVEVGDAGQSWPLTWRASRTAGFATFLGFRTDRQQALVLLGNSDVDLSALGIAWLEERSPPALPEPSPLPPKSVVWDDYPGLYKIEGGAEFVVRTDVHGMFAQFRGQPGQMLRAVEDDVFVGDTFGIAFSRENHKVNGALVNIGSMHVQATRLSEHAPSVIHAPIPIDAKTTAELAGDYRLDAATLARVRAGSGTITLQITGRAALALTAFAKDHYADSDGSCEVAFRRDDKNAVTGLTLSFAGVDRPAERVVWTAPTTQ